MLERCNHCGTERECWRVNFGQQPGDEPDSAVCAPCIVEAFRPKEAEAVKVKVGGSPIVWQKRTAPNGKA